MLPGQQLESDDATCYDSTGRTFHSCGAMLVLRPSCSYATNGDSCSPSAIESGWMNTSPPAGVTQQDYTVAILVAPCAHRETFFFLPCRARHDSSDGRSRLHTIRTQLKDLTREGNKKQQKTPNNTKQKTQTKNTTNTFFFFSHAVRAMTAPTVVQDCILFAHNSKEKKDLVRGGSKPNKQPNNKTQHPNQTKNHKQDNQPNRPQKLRSRR